MTRSTVRTATRPSTAVNTPLWSAVTLTWKDEPRAADSAFAYAWTLVPGRTPTSYC